MLIGNVKNELVLEVSPLRLLNFYLKGPLLLHSFHKRKSR